MKFEIDIDKLIDYGLSLNQYAICQFIYQQNYPLMETYMSLYGSFKLEDYQAIIKEEYINLHDSKRGLRFSNFYITNKFINQFIEKPSIDKVKGECVEDWIDIWYNLFPKGIKTMGYLVRSDKNGCIKKMKSFIKVNPEFKKEIILKATYDYIQYFRMKNWQGIQIGHYFILKNGVSTLASLCENIVEKIESGKEVNLNIITSSLDGYGEIEDNSALDRL